MSGRRFAGSFTQQEPIPPEAIAAAVKVMETGRLHRYNVTPDEAGEVAELEREYRDWQGAKYCLAVTSGGQAMQLALRAAGVKPGDRVLTNAFTLAPVPGAIAAVGGVPELVEIDDGLTIDLDDFAAKAAGDARVLMLSHMRGHVADMDRLCEIACANGVTIIEDCAHTMGARWRGKLSGNFGIAGCFSTQTYKHINSGEGGLLTSNDADFIARATVMSGSYMLYPRHGAGPEEEAFAEARYMSPNMSCRMDALRAAILRPQLKTLDRQIERWNERFEVMADGLARSNRITVPMPREGALRVASSIQFGLPALDEAGCRAMVRAAGLRGVELKWFGDAEPVGFTSAHGSWKYAPAQTLPETDRILSTLFDMRLPLTFSLEDCALIADLIVEAAEEIG